MAHSIWPIVYGPQNMVHSICCWCRLLETKSFWHQHLRDINKIYIQLLTSKLQVTNITVDLETILKEIWRIAVIYNWCSLPDLTEKLCYTNKLQRIVHQTYEKNIAYQIDLWSNKPKSGFPPNEIVDLFIIIPVIPSFETIAGFLICSSEQTSSYS